MTNLINPIDRHALRQQVRQARPFPFFCIDGFLEKDFAQRVLAAFPAYDEAVKMGKTFNAVNERAKVQLADASKFAEPIAQLNQILAEQEFLDLLSYAMDIPKLLPDDQLLGGGIHETGPRGRLDVHVDSNFLKERKLHRRLNILIYFNTRWREEWGGNIELWNRDVTNCAHSFSPIFNRCVVFETNEISYHGVSAVKCPQGMSRKSFAAYYYTKEAPAHWTGEGHSAIYKARPGEGMQGKVLMPMERTSVWLKERVHSAREKIKGR